jgi:hypothetical protein
MRVFEMVWIAVRDVGDYFSHSQLTASSSLRELRPFEIELVQSFGHVASTLDVQRETKA